MFPFKRSPSPAPKAPGTRSISRLCFRFLSSASSTLFSFPFPFIFLSTLVPGSPCPNRSLLVSILASRASSLPCLQQLEQNSCFLRFLILFLPFHRSLTSIHNEGCYLYRVRGSAGRGPGFGMYIRIHGKINKSTVRCMLTFPFYF